MAIKISGSTIIDDSRNLVNAGIITATSLDISSNLNVTGVTTSTDISLSGKYTSTATEITSSINCSLSNYFTTTVNGNRTFSVSNIPSGVYSFTLEINHISGSITWFSNVQWPAGTAPDLTTGKKHLIMFVTSNSGSTWRASSLVDYNS